MISACQLPQMRENPPMESEAKESPKGFISAPSIDELRPTKEEQAKIEWLWAWEEQSRKSQFVWH